ncbi:hypothetical protein ACWGI8_29355 [Streptomyces sp. NPDC054841]
MAERGWLRKLPDGRFGTRTCNDQRRHRSLIRDAGTPLLDDRVRALRAELDVAGLTSMTPTLDVAVAFHQAVLDEHDELAATIARLREQTRDGTCGMPLRPTETRAAEPSQR